MQFWTTGKNHVKNRDKGNLVASTSGDQDGQSPDLLAIKYGFFVFRKRIWQFKTYIKINQIAKRNS